MFSLGYLIVTYNGADSIETLINGISFKSGILVVDNASTDNTVEIVEGLHIKMLENKENLGYGAAINQGLKELGKAYSHVMILNQDIVIKQFPRDTEKYADYAIIQPLVTLPNDRINVTTLSMNVFGYIYPPHYHTTISKNMRKPREMFFFSGATFIINLAWYQKIGHFDESLFLYYEDADYAFRTFLAGGKIIYYPDMIVEHAYKNSVQNKQKRSLLSHNRKKILNRYCHAVWKFLIGVKNISEDQGKTSKDEKKRIAHRLKKELLLGFHTKQFSFFKRSCINMLLVPYSWIVKRFI